MRRIVFLVLPLAFALSACRTVPRVTDNAAGFRAALAGVADRPNVAAGSDAERTGIEGVKGLLGKIDAANVRASTSKVYAPDCYLNDTLKTLHGSAAIEAYFLATAETAESVAATFDDVTRSGDGLYYFRWVMETRLKKVAKGEAIRTIGISVVRFDAEGRVLVHQDYWDSATGLFDHVPVVGWGTRAIKARL